MQEVIYLELDASSRDEDPNSKDYIHDAQISVMVTGIDNWLVRIVFFFASSFKPIVSETGLAQQDGVEGHTSKAGPPTFSYSLPDPIYMLQ